ncbi:Dipeptidyl-peptidase 5, partial [Tilletia horrida]
MVSREPPSNIMQVDSLDELKAQYCHEVVESEEEVWEFISKLEVSERIASRSSSDPVLEPMLATIPDPFDQYGPPKQDDQILSILTPTSLLSSFTVLPSPSLGGGSSTPSALIEAPQVGAGIVSPNGLHALVGVSEHDLGSPAKVTTRKTIYHLGLPAHIAGRRSGSKDKDKDGPALAKPQPLVHTVTEAVFIGDDEAVWLHQGTLYYKNVSQPNLEPFLPGTPVGAFPDGVEVTTLKAVSVSDKKRTLVFSAEVYDDGKLEAVKDHDESDVEQEWERVRAYDSTFVRHWDRFIKNNKRSQLFAIDLERKSDTNGEGWQFSSDGFRNLLQGTKLETPVPPFGGAEDYDVNKDHVILTSRDPEGNAA